MTVYNPPTDTELGIEKPILSSVNIRLRDMAIAITEGSSPAPAIQTAALEQTGGSEAVTQACIRDSAVGQGQLKTTTSDVSRTSGSGHSTLAGGQYTLWPQTRVNVGTSIMQVAEGIANTSFISQIYISTATIGYVSTRYVQASPPYDLGDG